MAVPADADAQDVDPDSIVVIERGTPGPDGWDVADLPFQIVTAPLYLLALGGEWAAHGLAEGRMLRWALHLNAQLNRRGLYPGVADLGSGSGTGAALSVGVPAKADKAWGYVRGGATYRGYWRLMARAGYGVEDVSPSRDLAFGAYAFGVLSDRPEDEYFGIGNDSREADRSDYERESRSAGVTLGLAAARGIAISATLDYSRVETAPGNNDRLPDLDSIFPRDDVPRFGAEDRYLSVGGELEWRSAYEGILPEGRWLRLGFAWNRSDSEGAADFSRVEAAAGLDVPFDYERRALSLAVLYQTLRRSGDGAIPFYRLPALGGSSTLSAYRTGRFRDRELVFGRAEYAYRIWLNPTASAAVVASAFASGGMVAADIEEAFRFSELQPSYGVSLGTAGAGGLGSRLELAFGDEGMRVNLTLTANF